MEFSMYDQYDISLYDWKYFEFWVISVLDFSS